MNKLTIIGNLTKDPELRTTTSGESVCGFTVAVNKRKKIEGQPDATFFKVSAWRELGENCAKYLQKGKKVAVIGSVDVHPFLTQKGEAAANLEVNATEVEFLSSRQEQMEIQPPAEKVDQQSGYTAVTTDELPF